MPIGLPHDCYLMPKRIPWDGTVVDCPGFIALQWDAMELPTIYGTAMVLPWNAMGLEWVLALLSSCHGIAIGVPRNCHEMPWDCH